MFEVKKVYVSTSHFEGEKLLSKRFTKELETHLNDGWTIISIVSDTNRLKSAYLQRDMSKDARYTK